MAETRRNRYDALIEEVFFANYKAGDAEVCFDRSEFSAVARRLGIAVPKNLGDIVYSYRYRAELPPRIVALLAEGQEWVIRPAGPGKYVFAKTTAARFVPNPSMSYIKVLDATPEIIRRYALNDEQALLAILRYNRLIDVFLGITCYPLQSHLRTTVQGMGQTETDEMYVGLNRRGQHFVIPVQVKSSSGEVGVVQIEQDLGVCESKFPGLICRPVGAQFMGEEMIALFEFGMCDSEIRVMDERHYRLVPNKELSDAELRKYNQIR